MTRGQLAGRLREIAAMEPQHATLALHRLALELEQGPPDDLEALVRATQPSGAPPRRGILRILRGPR